MDRWREYFNELLEGDDITPKLESTKNYKNKTRTRIKNRE